MKAIFSLVAAASLASASSTLAGGAGAAPASGFSWSGVFVGAYAGGSFSSNKLVNLNSSTDVSFSPSAFTGGALVGFNYQIDAFVLGAEGEFGSNAWKATGNYLNGNGGTRNATSESTYIGRVRGRAGYAMDNMLFFISGGASFADDRVTQTNPNNGRSDSIRKDLAGWNVGAGVEYAFTGNWTGRLEYIYDNFGKTTYDFQSLPTGFANRSVRLESSSVRVGLQYKF